MDFAFRTTDPHSFAIPEMARVTDTHFDLNVDFNRKILFGTITLSIVRKLGINRLVLDCNELVIKEVRNCEDKKSCLNYYIGLPESCGRPFTIQLPVDLVHKSRCKIQLTYETSPNSPALHWLEPAQTADGLYPFLLSNNMLIYARAMFPCQDTPSVKFTYSAHITVPDNYTVIMSANYLANIPGPMGHVTYIFGQKSPIPACGVFIAVGVLQKKQLSARCNVYAERTFFDDSLRTFCSDTIESVLQVTESLFGAYFWDRWDICVLPPSIADFEIECPYITFISPTILCGDRSLIVSSLVQSISRSWTGNLVTCANYNHLWLNKSFSTFIGRKILFKVLNHSGIISCLLNISYKNTIIMIENLKETGLLKCLVPDLVDSSPHDAIQYVPYELGCVLLGDLEDILGGPSIFEPFLISYFNQFAYKSIKTEDWKHYLYQYFPDKKKLLDDFEWDMYLYGTDFIFNLSETLEIEFYNIAEECTRWEKHNIPKILTYRSNLCDIEKLLLLHQLHHFYTRLTVEKLIVFADHYKFDNANDTIRFQWLLLCIKLRWSHRARAALSFALRYCSLGYAFPIFEKLFEWPEKHDEARRAYIKEKDKMLHGTQEYINAILDRTKGLFRLE